MISPRVRRVMIKAIIIICGIESPIVWKNLRIFFFRVASQSSVDLGSHWMNGIDAFCEVDSMLTLSVRKLGEHLCVPQTSRATLCNCTVPTSSLLQGGFDVDTFRKADSWEHTHSHTHVWNTSCRLKYEDGNPAFVSQNYWSNKKNLLTMVFKTTYGKLDLYAPLRKKHRSKITTMPEQPSKNVFLWFLRMVFKIIRTTIWKLDRYALVLFRKAFCREKASNQK